jgi:SRSO17 transposase
MAYVFGGAGERRLTDYFDGIGRHLGRPDRRESFAMYALGLLGDAERKSVEPIAARACGEPELCRAYTERLLHFVTDSPWRDQPIREYAARYAIESMTAREPVEAWIVDDTGFPKQGNKSPGVQRQYSGTLGKTGNCQVAPSLTIATRTQELPIDMDLYLPESWTSDRTRCRIAHIPDEVEYRPKWRMALDLITRNVEAGVPLGVLLGDSAFGDVGAFRDGARALGFDYALDVKCHTRVEIVNDDGSVSDPMSVETASTVVGARSYRKVTWRQGTRGPLAARFAMIRVHPITGKGIRGEEQWLVIEKPSEQHPADHYVLATLPKSMTRKQVIRRIKQRWRIERTYEDLKGELGLDHFEGRSYRGWQHHVTCAMACYAFLVAERARAFPPSARGSKTDHTIARAA